MKKVLSVFFIAIAIFFFSNAIANAEEKAISYEIPANGGHVIRKYTIPIDGKRLTCIYISGYAQGGPSCNWEEYNNDMKVIQKNSKK